ncbi:HIT domain-containing protein [Solicola gregarius]|uniref:HIT domain-containing protein n=1 Tax=Solicola gregarius TaxID=2908642 RepID=A0AA46TN00_9ACTN|nr:HIT domain-containing protein [Solicola gregarius]UYM07924.1 HIT domain-containing protein [Solicola gregarius]
MAKGCGIVARGRRTTYARDRHSGRDDRQGRNSSAQRSWQISADHLVATTLTARRIAIVALSELGADGVDLLDCRGATAWQTVFHLHLHVVLRYRDKDKDRPELPYEPGSFGDDLISPCTPSARSGGIDGSAAWPRSSRRRTMDPAFASRRRS